MFIFRKMLSPDGSPQNTDAEDDTELEDDKPTGDPEAKPNAGKPGADPRIHKANEEAKKYRQERNTFKTKLDGVTDRLNTVEAELKTERDAREKAEKEAIKSAKAAAAAKYKLPAKLAERLTGATTEEIEADAEALAKELPQPTGGVKPQPSPMNFGGGAGGLSLDDIKNMSAQDIAKRWNDPEFQKQLKAVQSAN